MVETSFHPRDATIGLDDRSLSSSRRLVVLLEGKQSVGGMAAARQAATDMLAPPRKKPASVEAERVVGVLQAAQRRLLVASALYLPNLAQTLATLRGIVPAATLKELESHQQLQLDFRPSDTARAMVADSVRSLVRTLVTDAHALQALQAQADGKMGIHQDDPLRQLSTSLDGLHALVFSRLLTTVVEDQDRGERLGQLQMRSRKVQQETAEVEAALAAATRTHQEQMSAYQQVTQQLSNDIASFNERADRLADRVDHDTSLKFVGPARDLKGGFCSGSNQRRRRTRTKSGG